MTPAATASAASAAISSGAAVAATATSTAPGLAVEDPGWFRLREVAAAAGLTVAEVVANGDDVSRASVMSLQGFGDTSIEGRPAGPATVAGVPAGSQCRLFVVANDGSREFAGSWLVGEATTTVDGSALVAPADVAAVQLETYAGQVLATATI